MHAILASFGTDGDIFPYISLARTLISKGHQVTLLLPQPHQQLAIGTGAEFEPIVTSTEMEAFLGHPDLWHPIKSGLVASKWGRPLIRRQFELIRDCACRCSSIIVANPGVLAARVARDALQIPLVSMVLQPGVIPSNSDPPVLAAGPRLPTKAPELLKNGYWWMLDQIGYHLTGREVVELQTSLGLQPMKRLFRWWLSPDLVLAVFPKWFAPQRTDWPSQLQHIGFQQDDGRALNELSCEAEDFLTTGSPPILFTPGSEVRHGRQFFRDALDACEHLARRAILLTKHSESIPKELPQTARHFEYLPFQLIFPRCCAVVHHGGIGTCAKALAAGVPQVVRPFAWDQFDNAERLRKLGVGTVVQNRWLSGNNLLDSIVEALSEGVCTQAKSLASRQSQHSANLDAVGWIEELFERAQNSTFFRTSDLV